MGASPSGRWGWSARVIATRASRLRIRPCGRKTCKGVFQCGSPALGAMGWWSARVIATRASLLRIRPPWVKNLQGRVSMWEPRPRGDGVVVCEGYRCEGVAPTNTPLWAKTCKGRVSMWEPRPRGDGGGLRGFSRRGRCAYEQAPVGEKTARGVFRCGSPALGAMGWWSARVIATRALRQRIRPPWVKKLQGACLFVGAPPSGRWGVICKGYRDEGVAPTYTPLWAKNLRGPRAIALRLGLL